MDREQMRARLAQLPNSVSLREARAVLEAYGWNLDHVRGSHHYFRRGRVLLSIPLRRPHILPVYVRQILKATQEDADGDDDA